MKRILISIDDTTAKVLDNYGNKSETVRQALRIYHEDISTDTLAGMRKAFTTMLAEYRESQQRSIELYDLLERVVATLEELANR